MQRSSWTVRTADGRVMSGYLPAWAEEDPSQSDVPADAAWELLTSLTLSRRLGTAAGLPSSLARTIAERPGEDEEEPFSYTLRCAPHGPEGSNFPLVDLHMAGGRWLAGLTPKDLTEASEWLKQVARVLDHQVRPTLVEARRNWVEHMLPADRAAGQAQIAEEGRGLSDQPPLIQDPAKLTAARERAGLTRTEFARRIGVSLSHACDMETGRRNATAARIGKIAKVLGCSVTTLLWSENLSPTDD